MRTGARGPMLSELFGLVKGADSVELRLAVCDVRRQPAISTLEVDPFDAEIRQVYFFDTPELALDRLGLMICARSSQSEGMQGDSMMKLRSTAPGSMPADADLGIETMPGGYVCSGAIRRRTRNEQIRAAVLGEQPLHTLFTWRQQEFFVEYAPPWVALDGLSAIGPVTVLELGLEPAELKRRLALELWNYPDDPRLLEFSTRISPEEMIDATAQTSHFLRGKGLSVEGAVEGAVPAVP
ncbi:hypothetical protein [Nonomuraea lactucae]|uniref:hypothetical protein n=1 Tax=Nonomuraea lactucae TaxID=2249762 RepID=UPI0013B39092|nr:hypothetical protein [Nonomuraea lactucae]